MGKLRFSVGSFFCFWVLGLLVLSGGCQTGPGHGIPAVHRPSTSGGCCAPRELSKVVLPKYVIEPPDILWIEAVHIVPRSPYRLKTLDSILLQVWGTVPDAPIGGVYLVEPGGLVGLGVRYGSVKIAGLTIDEAKVAVQEHLRNYVRDPFVSVTLADIAAKQQIAGEHLVGPDGTVTLGSYGSVSVVGQTIAGAKAAIEQHLAEHLEDPEVSVNVFAFNSKVYYIVTQGAGLGDGVYRFPVTGNETVLDAISHINGLEMVSSKRIWIARPSLNSDSVQVLPVDWNAITAQASANTNYQLFPGDRVFIAEDKLIAFDTAIAKLTSPLERIMGFALLSTGTVTRLSGSVLTGGGNPLSTF
ncbi:MAG: polysaccharide biosynthesis/export family protein [Planctomycetes bacterium]|nr:polysaccharide biosynthesis/export family protein [Planctomycetota bacterium]